MTDGDAAKLVVAIAALAKKVDTLNSEIITMRGENNELKSENGAKLDRSNTDRISIE